jgi:polysaccharide chain length determinant protein (PEP-CTERM system associated)
MVTNAATSLGLNDYLGIIRRRSLYVASIAPPVLLLSIFVAFWLKPTYQATATILLQASTVTKDVITSTVTADTDEQIDIVQDRVLRPDSLLPLVRGLDPYPQDHTSDAAQKARRVLGATSLEKVDPVSFAPTSDRTNVFSLHYRNPNPQLAAAVTRRLAQLFLDYNQRQRAQAASDTAAFLRQQAANVTREMSQVDAELAKFKTSVGDALPELRDQNRSEIDLAERSLESLQQQILAAEGKESELSVELGQMSPNLITQSGDMTDLATLRAHLAEAEQRYTPQHPEVIRLKRALQAMLAQQNAADKAPKISTERSLSAGIVTSATNPQYVMAATELESVRRDLAALQAQASRQQQKIDRYEELLRRTPAVERTESEILRRRESLQTQYQQIQDKLQSAQEAQSFEAEQRGDRFVLLRAPDVPGSPVSPNRKGLIALGLLLALGLAAVVVAIVEAADTNIRTVSDLPDQTAIPLLATIPVIENPQDRLHRRMLLSAFTLAYGIAAVVVGSVVAQALHHH